jgi:hemerythrin-like domain-containing protein
MIPLKQLKETDPLLRNAEKAMNEEEFSPMDPPDAFDPPARTDIGYDTMHPFLKGLMDEHKSLIALLDSFERTLERVASDGLSRENHVEIGDFFRNLDDQIVRHNLQEEKILFPLLSERLLASGDHSKSDPKQTAVDMLEDDHIKFMQLAAISFNFIGLAGRLPDGASAAMTLDAGLEQGKVLVELLRLHIFREDNIVFPMAHERITEVEFDAMQNRTASMRAPVLPVPVVQPPVVRPPVASH